MTDCGPCDSWTSPCRCEGRLQTPRSGGGGGGHIITISDASDSAEEADVVATISDAKDGDGAKEDEEDSSFETMCVS